MNKAPDQRLDGEHDTLKVGTWVRIPSGLLIPNICSDVSRGTNERSAHKNGRGYLDASLIAAATRRELVPGDRRGAGRPRGVVRRRRSVARPLHERIASRLAKEAEYGTGNVSESPRDHYSISGLQGRHGHGLHGSLAGNRPVRGSHTTRSSAWACRLRTVREAVV